MKITNANDLDDTKSRHAPGNHAAYGNSIRVWRVGNERVQKGSSARHGSEFLHAPAPQDLAVFCRLACFADFRLFFLGILSRYPTPPFLAAAGLAGLQERTKTCFECQIDTWSDMRSRS